MAIQARAIERWFTHVPAAVGTSVQGFLEPASEKLAWMELSRLADIPSEGRELFSGTLAQKNSLFREFRSFVRQARVYWDAARATRGSAAALPYYYCFLQLAKAELLQSHPAEVLGARLGHGLSYKTNGTRAFGSDDLTVHNGAFRLLVDKRLGLTLPNRTALPIPNLLRLIPEIGHEVATITTVRPSSIWGYHSVASAGSDAWSVLGLVGEIGDEREHLMRTLRRSYRQVDLASVGTGNWRNVFALSTRSRYELSAFESKQAFSIVDHSGSSVPDYGAAGLLPASVFGAHLSSAGSAPSDLLLTHSVYKTRNLVLSLPLIRYAAVFYLSSLVRYKPSALDPRNEPRQSWIMDSFVEEVPLQLLVNSWEAIARQSLSFEANGFRV